MPSKQTKKQTVVTIKKVHCSLCDNVIHTTGCRYNYIICHPCHQNIQDQEKEDDMSDLTNHEADLDQDSESDTEMPNAVNTLRRENTVVIDLDEQKLSSSQDSKEQA